MSGLAEAWPPLSQLSQGYLSPESDNGEGSSSGPNSEQEKREVTDTIAKEQLDLVRKFAPGMRAVVPLTTLPRAPGSENESIPALSIFSRVDDALQHACDVGIRVSGHHSVRFTAMVYIQRFYAQEPVERWDMRTMALAAYFLASKACENPRRLSEIVGVSYGMYMRRISSKQQSIPPGDALWLRIVAMQDGAKHLDPLKAKILQYEAHLLKALDFDVHIALPHYILSETCDRLFPGRDDYLEASLSFASQAMFLPLILEFSPETIAAACVILGVWLVGREPAADKGHGSEDTGEEDHVASAVTSTGPGFAARVARLLAVDEQDVGDAIADISSAYAQSEVPGLTDRGRVIQDSFYEIIS